MRQIPLRLKITHLIPPVASLLLVGIWNISQMRSISELEGSTATLREKIAARAASGDFPDATRPSGRPLNKATGDKSAIDWKHVSANIIADDADGNVEIRAMIDFQLRLSKMTRDEMIAALDEIATLDLTDAERAALEQKILENLIKLDPAYALDRFVDRIESDPDGVGWQLSGAMKDWAKKDLKAASAWLDRQIASGKFESKTLDGESESRVQFESSIMEALLSSDLNSAGNRLAALPEEQRREVLEQMTFSDLSAEQQKSYAALVRQLIPADEREGSFAHIAEELVDEKGYGKVSEFLDGVHATREERVASAKQTAESRLASLASDSEVTQAEVDSLRTWLDQQAPGQTDSITGKSLAEAAQNGDGLDFSEASQLALHYQKTSGSDDVLVAFLQSYSAHSNLEEARHLADMIGDVKRREEILRDLK